MKYLNLELQVGDYRADDDGEHFSVRVLNSPAGQQRDDLADEVTLPVNLRQRLRQLEKRSLTSREVIDLGKGLAARLFPVGARWYLDQSRAKLEEDEGLRIQLRLETYALADLPWEYVYIPRPDTPPGQEPRDGFLVLDPRTSLVRYEVLGQAPGTLEPVGAGPLRMVVLLADPDVPGYNRLNLDVNLRNIQEALKEVPDPGIQVDPYPNATRQMLLDAVQSEPHPHIFHFAGHGAFKGNLGQLYGTVEGEGYLVLVGDQQQEDLFSADTLALNLKGRHVRLAVLGACEAGRRDGVNAWTGVVPDLTRAGIPAVVGMQYKIFDKNALHFDRSFYRALADGKSIDAAVTDGRQAICTLSGFGDRDWGVPVLYLRAEEGVLFPKTQPGPVPPPPAGVDKRALREAMVDHFELEDLEVLCSDVQLALEDAHIREQVNLEIVGGHGKRAKVLSLIQYLDRRGYLGYLVNAVRQHRPGII